MQIQLSDHFTYKKLLRFCISPILMMLFISIYGVVDGLFISNFTGKTSFAAVNLILPFVFILGGFGFMIGTGGSALVAKTLGEGKQKLACHYFTMMIQVVLIGGMIFSMAALVCLRPIAEFLGASDEMMKDCLIYGGISLIFCTAFMLQNVFQNFLITAEKPQIALGATIAAGLTNMVLDALFVAVFQWGVAGAAIATGISQCIGGLLPLIYFCRPNDSCLRLIRTKLEWRTIGKACSNGFSEILSSISRSVVSMLYNYQLLRFAGENGVAAYGAIMYVEFIFIAIFIGFTISTSPIISFHYGAKNQYELRSLLRKSIHLTLLTGTIMTVISVVIAGDLAKLFVGYDEALCGMTEHAFVVFSISYVLAGLNIFISSFFTALNDGFVSALISFLRVLVFQLLCVLLLPVFFEIEGIWWAISLSEACALLVSVTFIVIKRHKYQYA